MTNGVPAELIQALGEALGMLFDAILERLRTVPHGPEVPVDSADHCFPAMTKLASDGVGTDWRAVVETLQPCAGEGVPERFRANLSGLPAGPHRDRI